MTPASNFADADVVAIVVVVALLPHNEIGDGTVVIGCSGVNDESQRKYSKFFIRHSSS